MEIRTNIGLRQRWLHICVGLLLMGYGLLGLRGMWIGLLIAGSGVVTLITGLIRWCPMCSNAECRRSEDIYF